MVDIILFSFACGVFYGGFYLGAKYGTLRALAKSATAAVKSWL